MTGFNNDFLAMTSKAQVEKNWKQELREIYLLV